MTKTFCDKCGKEIGFSGENINIEFSNDFKKVDEELYESYVTELCKDCYVKAYKPIKKLMKEFNFFVGEGGY